MQCPMIVYSQRQPWGLSSQGRIPPRVRALLKEKGDGEDQVWLELLQACLLAPRTMKTGASSSFLQSLSHHLQR